MAEEMVVLGHIAPRLGVRRRGQQEHFWDAEKRPGTEAASGSPPAGRSCMKQIWSCSGSASTSRNWSPPPTAAVRGRGSAAWMGWGSPQAQHRA